MSKRKHLFAQPPAFKAEMINRKWNVGFIFFPKSFIRRSIETEMLDISFFCVISLSGVQIDLAGGLLFSKHH